LPGFFRMNQKWYEFEERVLSFKNLVR
jgi:hypothetical protein